MLAVSSPHPHPTTPQNAWLPVGGRAWDKETADFPDCPVPYGTKNACAPLFFLPLSSKFHSLIWLINVLGAFSSLPTTIIYEEMLKFSIERRSVTSRLHSGKLSGTQKSFLTEMAICIVERWKKSMGYCFVPECNHVRESHASQFFRFFLQYFQDRGLLRSRNFATMATWRNDFSL